MKAKDISNRLAERAESVARYLLPKGKRMGNEWRVGNVNGDLGDSLSICVTGDKVGLWHDFATGEGGDLLELWCLNRKINLQQAMSEAKQWLGVPEYNFVSQVVKRYVRPNALMWMNKKINQAVSDYLKNERKLTEEIITKFKIGAENRYILFLYWRDDELIQVKRLHLDRPDNKKQILVEADCEPCLFGWDAVNRNSRTITLCEGEIDAMTLHQYGVNALSVPFGAGAGGKHKWLEFEFDRLALFDEIYLCFDQDEAGQKAVEDLIDRLGRHRCRIVTLPYKDPNECLQKGLTTNEIQNCFHQARTCDPIELKSASEFMGQVVNEFYPSDGIKLGINPPWQKAIGKIMFRPDELSIWTGINGHGKSQLLGQIILSSMLQHAKVCVASLELKPKRLLMRLTRQATTLEVPSIEYIQAVHEWYQDKLWIFDLVGNTKTERLLDVFLYARQRYGVDTFVIDSLMKCGIAEDDYKSQKIFIEQLCDFKNQHECHIHIVMHPRKGFDETRPPGKLDIKGTGAITDLADNCFTVWRNKSKEEKLRIVNQINDQSIADQPDCLLICDKQRNGDWEGKISLWFDPKSYQFLNYSSQKPVKYVDFSILDNVRKIL